nr:another transcription unit protein [Drosophila takahashii]
MGQHPKYRELQAGEKSDGNNAGFYNRHERRDSSSSAGEAGSLNSRQLPEASPTDDASSDGSPVYDEEAPQDSPVHPIDEELPKMLADKLTVEFKATLPADSDLLDEQPLILKMPHFIKVESKAYDPQNFKNAMTREDLKDEQARDDFINRLKTTVRWRMGPNNEMESNARIVRWSDGSETFHVGGEAFDIVHHPVTNDQSHLYVRHGSYYQPQGLIKDKLTLRPKLDSVFGQSHVQGLRNRAVNKPKTGGVKVLTDMGADPVQDRERRVKEEMAQLRREEREERDKRRYPQLNRRKPSVLPTPHCSTPNDWEDGNYTQSVSSVNSNTLYEQENYASVDEFDEDDRPSSSTLKPKKVPQSNSNEGLLIGGAKRKTKPVVYSSSDEF